MLGTGPRNTAETMNGVGVGLHFRWAERGGKGLKGELWGGEAKMLLERLRERRKAWKSNCTKTVKDTWIPSPWAFKSPWTFISSDCICQHQEGWTGYMEQGNFANFGLQN